MSGKMIAEAAANNLHVEPIPEELVSQLWIDILLPCIPFAKMTALPKGGQHGVHGPVICVPSNAEKAITIVPRCGSHNQMIRVQLKRRLLTKVMSTNL